MTSKVLKLVPNEFISFRQMADTKDIGEGVREKEWAGGEESYLLAGNDSITILTVAIDIPPGH